MAEYKLADFDILIHGEKAPYAVVATYHGRTATGSFAPDIRDPEWHQAYITLAQTMVYPDLNAILKIGSELWRALMQESVRELWISARRDIEQNDIPGIRLRLDLQSPYVSALAWESLYDPDRNEIFAIEPHYTLVRVASIYRHVGPPRRANVQLPLHLLVVAPDDPTNQIDSQREIEEIRTIMETIDQRMVKVEEMTGAFSITDLRTRLAHSKPHILHFIGHGDPTGLWFWPRGEHVLAPAQSLRSVLRNSPSVKFVFLNACLAGRAARPIPFSGVADQLMQAGVPAVVAMQYQIRDHIAIDFAHFLYAELLGGNSPGIIDVAVNSARTMLFESHPGDFSYGTPILWLNRDEGRIFTLESAKEEEAKEENPTDETKADDSKDDIQADVTTPTQSIPLLDTKAEMKWIDEMIATTSLSHLTGELLLLRNKWSNFIDELRSLLLQLDALAEQPEAEHFVTLYTAKVKDYQRYKAALLRTKRLIEEAKDKA